MATTLPAPDPSCSKSEAADVQKMPVVQSNAGKPRPEGVKTPVVQSDAGADAGCIAWMGGRLRAATWKAPGQKSRLPYVAICRVVGVLCITLHNRCFYTLGPGFSCITLHNRVFMPAAWAGGAEFRAIGVVSPKAACFRVHSARNPRLPTC